MDITRRAFVVGLGAAAMTLAGCGTESETETEDAPAEDVPIVEDAPAQEPSESTEAPAGYESYDAPSGPEPYVRESVWWCIDNATGGGKYLRYGVLLGCTDPVNCYVLMKLRVTAKAADGSVLASDTATVQFIAPDDVMPYDSQMDVSEEPSEVTFELAYDKGAVPGNAYTLADLPVSGETESESNGYTKWAGEYSNETGVAFESGCTPSVLLRSDGRLAAVYGSFDPFPVGEGSTSSFEVSEYADSVPAHDSFEVLIVPDLM
jgi:hypothetical protein